MLKYTKPYKSKIPAFKTVYPHFETNYRAEHKIKSLQFVVHYKKGFQ